MPILAPVERPLPLEAADAASDGESERVPVEVTGASADVMVEVPTTMTAGGQERQLEGVLFGTSPARRRNRTHSSSA